MHRRHAWQMTPEQRLKAAELLHQHTMELLRASPEGHAAHVRRNLRQRRDRNENAINSLPSLLDQRDELRLRN